MAEQLHPLEPNYQVTPGEGLQTVIQRLDMSQADLARRTGLSVKHINQISQGQAAISASTAVLLERVTGVDARVWTRLEAVHQVREGMRYEEERLESEVNWLDQFPIADLKKRGVIETSARGVEQLRELLRFFRVATPAAWNQVWATPTAYRLSQAFDPNFGALASWIRLGERQAEQSPDLPEFNRNEFRGSLPLIRDLTNVREPSEFMPKLSAICRGVGVALVVEPEIKGARINGVVRWLPSGNPLIMLSVRHRWADIFWFTFFHEAGHLLVHDRKRLTFVDAPRSSQGRNVAEAEADEFAGKILIPQEFERELIQVRSGNDIRSLAERIGVHPGIVAGRLQHDGIIRFNQYNDLRLRYVFDE